VWLLYNLLIPLTAVIWLPVMYLRSLRRAERPNWQERFGNYSFTRDKEHPRIWIHAVSVGEVLAVSPIIRQVRTLLPDYRIVLSVTTSSGHATAEGENEKNPGLYDHLVYAPIDVARFALSAMQQVQPAVFATMETELWMNLLWAARTFNARTLLINGRISDRSFPRSMKVRFFYRSVLSFLDQALMQTEVDADRIRQLGAKSAEVLGNCKFDQALAASPPDPLEVRKELGIPPEAACLVVGSTRGEEEERLVVDAIAELDAWKSGSLWVVHAPRHIETAPGLATLAAARLGVSPTFRSKGESGRYLVLDTYGELGRVYAAADVVVVGGGFSNHGGQNLIQPLALGKPVVHGPHMQNFRAAAESARAAGATLVASTAGELTTSMNSLLADADLRGKMGAAASELIQSNLGASRRYAEAIAAAAETQHQA
jgi:3-deoxy-D-manno-octulosonic-acid transferase